MMESKPHELTSFPSTLALPVQWGDQDLFGHVNNTVPIRWFESSRMDYLERSGLEGLLNELRLGPILASVTCHYRRQLFYPDTVYIAARVTRIGRTSMTMNHVVYSQSQQAVTADGDSVVVIFDYARNQPEPVPEEVRATLERLEGVSFRT